MSLAPAVILEAVRTPRGLAKPEGALAGVRPIALLEALFGELSRRDARLLDEAEDVVLGCVTQTGEQGADLARIAALYAGVCPRASGVTLNRFCVSGLAALEFAALRASADDSVIVAGGVESMSRVPMFSDQGAWFADPEVAARTGFVHMGIAADLVATIHGVDRARLDGIAARSHARAALARDEGRFARSVVAVETPDGRVVVEDEAIRPDCTLESLAALPSAFAKVGAKGADAFVRSRHPEVAELRHDHTVGTSPAMVDGASLLVVAGEGAARRLGAKPRARVLASAHATVDPVVMLTAGPLATRKALAKAGLEVADVDVFEFNESFAAVVAHYQDSLGIPDERLCPNGGAIALGHALGATGGNLVSMLIDELERRDGRYGVAAICGGAGIASAIVIERWAEDRA